MKPVAGVVIGLVVLVVGLVFLKNMFADSARVDAFKRAQPCPAAASAASDCYVLANGTLTSVYNSSGRNEGNHSDVTIATNRGQLSGTLDPSNSDSVYLNVGTPVQAKVYHGNLTTVLVRGRSIPSRYNPAHHQGEELLFGLVFSGMGLAVLGLTGFSFWAVLHRSD